MRCDRFHDYLLQSVFFLHEEFKSCVLEMYELFSVVVNQLYFANELSAKQSPST